MRFYISHSIRGFAGKDATASQMQANCDTVKAIAEQFRKVFPAVDFYVPAESEPFVQRAFDMGYLTEKQMLDVDCRIISDTCDAVIIYVPEGDTLQGGRLIEFNYAKFNRIPTFLFKNVEEAISWITHFIIKS